MGTPSVAYTKGLHDLGDGCFGWLQPDGSWGWSNAGLVVDGDESLLVDTLFDLRLTREMLAAMADASPAARQIDVLVNTHANGDHCYGNELVRDARIVASKACAEEMQALPPSAMAAMLENADALGPAGAFFREVFSPFEFAGIALTPPSETFEGRAQLRVGDKRVELLEVGPAHTRGDVLVHVPGDGVVFTGDILFVDGHPIIWEGPVGNWIRACDAILAMGARVIVPGHGPVTDDAGVVSLREYLVTLERETRERFEAGVPLREAIRDLGSRDFARGDGERVAVNVAALYRELGDPSPAPGPLELFGWMAELRRSRP